MNPSLDLKNLDPLERLKELCEKLENATYKIQVIHAFDDGTLAKASLLVEGTVIYEDIQWVNSDLQNDVERVMAALLLYNIGLGVDDEEDETPDSEDIAKMGMRAVAGLFKQISKDYAN